MPAHLIAETGSLQGLILPFDKGEEWIIGRSSDAASLVVDDPMVSRRHAKVTKTEDGFYIKNLSPTHPLLVNEEEHRELYLLQEGDRVQIGETIFLFSEETPSDLKSPSQEPSYDEVVKELENAEESSLDHDTIFEDEEEEDMPFNIPANSPFLLKVIAGPNAGAEIALEKGRTYTLGKDPATCDILFQDLSVSRNHAKLIVSPDGICEIEDLGSKNGTTLNGEVITEKQIATAQDLISLGTTIFFILDRDAPPQETIYSPKLDTSGESEEQPVLEEKTGVSTLLKKHWKNEPIPFSYLLGFGAVALTFLIVFITCFSLLKSETIEIVHKEPASEIQDALSAKKFSDIAFSFNPASGKLFLTGHVLNSVDYQEMRYQLSQIPFIMSIDDTVVIDESVAKMMNDLFSSDVQWQGIAIKTMAPGKFAAVGYIQTNAEMSAISEFLLVNFPYLDRLENKIAVEENLETQISGMFLSSGFGAVTYQLNLGAVVLSGVYDHNKTKEYDHIIKELKKLPAITSVKNYAVPTNPEMAALNISKDYQVGGISLYDGKGFNAILNGKIYNIGDVVNGMNIINIEENTILLEKDGIKYRIEYAR